MKNKVPTYPNNTPTVSTSGTAHAAILHIGFLSAVNNLLLLALPVYMLQVYDRVLPSSNVTTLLYITLIVGAALMVLGIVEFARAQFANRLAAKLDQFAGDKLFRVALYGPRAALGDVQPLRDLATIRSFVASRTVFFLFDLPFAPLFMLLLYFVHPLVCLATVLGALAMFLIAVANQLATAKAGKAAGDALGQAMTFAQSFARNFETIRALGMVRSTAEVWGNRFADSLVDADQVSSTNAYWGALSRTLRLLIQMVVLGLGAWLVLDGQMTAGMIFAASMVSARALQPLDQIVGAWRLIFDARTAWKRIELGLKASTETSSRRLALPPPRGSLRLENVVYVPPGAAPGSAPLIRGISLRVEAGETVAVIGPSQAGKSTFARLLVGAIQPRSGIIRIDGADLQNWDPDQLGRHVGYLSQEVELFPGTIAQNISRFDSSPAEVEIFAAAERAFVHQLILAQPGGYETDIGPGGVRLSGGERQRIGLARAFYGDPRLLVLDEPNANLDADGEKALERAISAAKARGATVLVVTHRPSIAAKCEKVMMMRAGQVDAFGPAAEVLRQVRQARPGPTATANQSVSIARQAVQHQGEP